MIASRDQSGVVARAGSSAYHTGCQIKGHSRKLWDNWGRGKILFSIIFLLFLTLPLSAVLKTQELVFKRDKETKKTTDRSDTALSGGFGKGSKRVSKVSGMWELLLSPGPDRNSDRIKDGS